MEFRHLRFGELEDAPTNHPELHEAHPELLQNLLPLEQGTYQDFPIVFYAVEGGKVAAFFRSFPDQLFYAGRQFNWAWNGNLFTHPNFRRRGLAQAIVEDQINQFEQMNFVWGGVFSAPAALRLYEKLEFSMVGAAPRLFLIRNIRQFVRHHLPSFPSYLGESLYKGLFELSMRLLRARRRDARRVNAEEVSPIEFEKIANGHIVSEPNTAYWGNCPRWTTKRLEQRAADRIFLLRQEGEAEAFGFAVIRERQIKSNPFKGKYTGINLMTVMHYGYFDIRRDYPALFLTGLTEVFLNSEADMLELVSSSPGICGEAKRFGLLSLGDGMSFKFKEPSMLYGELPTQGVSAFHLTHYAGDAFSFE